MKKQNTHKRANICESSKEEHLYVTKTQAQFCTILSSQSPSILPVQTPLSTEYAARYRLYPLTALRLVTCAESVTV